MLLIYKVLYALELIIPSVLFCVLQLNQLTNPRRKRTGQRRKSLLKIEPVQERKQRMEQTTRLNRRKLKRAPWKRMTLGKAMKIMMTEKTSYKSLEDSPDVSVVQCQSRTKLLPAEVQLDATRWKWSCCMINTRTKEIAIASSISSGSSTGYEGYRLLSSDWSRKYATHVFF